MSKEKKSLNKTDSQVKENVETLKSSELQRVKVQQIGLAIFHRQKYQKKMNL